jgi:hypothetical protein
LWHAIVDYVPALGVVLPWWVSGPGAGSQDAKQPALHATYGTVTTAVTPGMSDPDAKINPRPYVNKASTERAS